MCLGKLPLPHLLTINPAWVSIHFSICVNENKVRNFPLTFEMASCRGRLWHYHIKSILNGRRIAVSIVRRMWSDLIKMSLVSKLKTFNFVDHSSYFFLSCIHFLEVFIITKYPEKNFLFELAAFSVYSDCLESSLSNTDLILRANISSTWG